MAQYQTPIGQYWIDPPSTQHQFLEIYWVGSPGGSPPPPTNKYYWTINGIFAN